uniref:Adrenomedullin-a n=1 Tax=Ornithodoros moubata TaxID=6938 RepID=L8B8G1_ORNMO|nr:adrenomedullin-a [Ornithodoros moubata]
MKLAFPVLLALSALLFFIEAAPVDNDAPGKSTGVQSRVKRTGCAISTCQTQNLADKLNQYKEHEAKEHSGGTGADSYGRRKRSLPRRKLVLLPDSVKQK